MGMSVNFRGPAALAGIVLGFGVMASGVAYACSCRAPDDAASQLAGADLMILAQVSSVRRLPPQNGSPMAETRFMVMDTIKGPERRSWVIRHQRGDSAMCGIDFRPGVDQAILARFVEGKVWTSSCERAWFPIANYRAAAPATRQE